MRGLDEGRRVREMTVRRRIEFSDTDQGGVVHFSRYFIFMETAEEEFLRSAGSGFVFTHQGRPGGWPKVAAACEYVSSARYGDELEILVRVEKLTRSTIGWAFTIRRGETVLARGRTTSVHCVHKEGGGFEAVPIPDWLMSRIDPDRS